VHRNLVRELHTSVRPLSVLQTTIIDTDWPFFMELGVNIMPLDTPAAWYLLTSMCSSMLIWFFCELGRLESH